MLGICVLLEAKGISLGIETLLFITWLLSSYSSAAPTPTLQAFLQGRAFLHRNFLFVWERGPPTQQHLSLYWPGRRGIRQPGPGQAPNADCVVPCAIGSFCTSTKGNTRAVPTADPCSQVLGGQLLTATFSLNTNYDLIFFKSDISCPCHLLLEILSHCS